MNTIIEDLITKWGITVNPTLLEYIVIMCSFFTLVLVLYLITKLVFRDASSNRTMFVKCALVFIGILVCLSAFADFGCNLIYGGGDTSEPSEPVTPTLKDGFEVYSFSEINEDEYTMPYNGYVVIYPLSSGTIDVEGDGFYHSELIQNRPLWIYAEYGDYISITCNNYTQHIAIETTLSDAIQP